MMADGEAARRRADRSSALGAFVAYLTLSAAYAWPLLAAIGTGIPNDPGDPLLNESIVWRNVTTVPFSSGWWNAPQFYPTQGVSAFTENLVGLNVIAAPVFWLSHNPALAYNVAYFLSWPLSAMAAFLLVRRITGRQDAGFLAGLAFAFTPYRTQELAHIQMLSSYGLPLMLFGLHGYLMERRAKWLWLFAAAWLQQSLTNGYLMFFGGVLVALWIAYFCSTRSHWKAGLVMLGAWAGASLLLVPVLYRYQTIHEIEGLHRGLGEVLWFSATPHSWIETTKHVWLWRSWLPDIKENLFPGLTVVVLVAIAIAVCLRRAATSRPSPPTTRRLRAGLAAVAGISLIAIVITLVAGAWDVTIAGVRVRMGRLDRALAVALLTGLPLLFLTRATREALARRSALVFYALATVIAAVLACGPGVRVGETTVLGPAPYTWLMALPGFDGLRVPARFWMVGMLCLSVAAALAWQAVRPAHGRLRRLVRPAIVIALLLDGWIVRMPIADLPAPRPTVEPSDRTEPILELPIGPAWDFAATYRASGHGRRVFNGVSGYNPAHYFALVTGLQARDPNMLGALAALGAYDVVIDRAEDQDGSLEKYVASAGGAVKIVDERGQSLYRIPAGALEPRLGSVLAISRMDAERYDAAVMHDGRMQTGWGDMPQRPGQWVQADLGQVQEVGGVTNWIGEYFFDFPRRLAIDLSVDGASWERVWEGSGAPAAFLACARAPKAADLRFVFPAARARFVRLTQLDHFHTMWRVLELQVHAPGVGGLLVGNFAGLNRRKVPEVFHRRAPTP
jgi:F5/8 type C domain-containing protein